MLSVGFFRSHFSAVWQWRGFVVGAATRELRSRYARSIFGWVWLIVPPVVFIAIYTLVFSQIARGAALSESGRYAYSISLCAGLLTWRWFSEVLSRVVGLFTNNAALLKKTLTPWYALLAVDMLVSLVTLAIQMSLFAILLCTLGRWPGWDVLIFVPLLAAQALFAVGIGLGLAVLQVFVRDIGLLVPLVLQIWFWLTPIVYPLSAISEPYRHWLAANPITPLVQGYQSVVVQGRPPLDWAGVLAVAAVGVLALALSVRLVRRNLPLIHDEI